MVLHSLKIWYQYKGGGIPQTSLVRSKKPSLKPPGISDGKSMEGLKATAEVHQTHISSPKHN